MELQAKIEWDQSMAFISGLRGVNILSVRLEILDNEPVPPENEVRKRAMQPSLKTSNGPGMT